MQKEITIDGYTFKYNKENNCYECRGEVCYDHEHDEVPEKGLWEAGIKLEKQLTMFQGYDCELEHSEKGWIEVNIYN